MSTTELKSDIHTLVDKTNDSNVLNIIYAILARLKRSKSESVTLTASERKAVDEALSSIKKGKTYPHSKVMADMQKKYPSLIK
jgi:predicted transcriptional regulator